MSILAADINVLVSATLFESARDRFLVVVQKRHELQEVLDNVRTPTPVTDSKFVFGRGGWQNYTPFVCRNQSDNHLPNISPPQSSTFTRGKLNLSELGATMAGTTEHALVNPASRTNLTVSALYSPYG